jgi:hypothetical protein
MQLFRTNRDGAAPLDDYTSMSAGSGERTSGGVAVRWLAPALRTTVGDDVAGAPLGPVGVSALETGQRLLLFGAVAV